MRRCSVVALAAVLMAPIVSMNGGPAIAQAEAFTLDGDIALLTVAINADKTADFEQVMAKLHEGLSKSQKPERRQQAAGWKVYRLRAPMPDGTIAYVHLINPVVRGADYTIMRTLYDEFPNERQVLYDLYRGAFAKNLSLATGGVVLDMSKAAEVSLSRTP